MSSRPRPKSVSKPVAEGKGAARPKPKAASRAASRRRKSSLKAAAPGGMWSWQTPDESWKTRWALKLIGLTLLLVALWGGEVQLSADEWKIGLRNVQGRPWVGLTWARNHSPRFWRAR